MRRFSIALLEENFLFQAALEQSFDGDPIFEILGHRDLLSTAADRADVAPDIIVMESASMDVGVVALLRHRFGHAKIMMICCMHDAQGIRAAVQSGVSACLSKRSTPSELVRAARCVVNGEQYLSPTLALQLLTVATQKPSTHPDPFKDLTDREEQIVKLLGIGLSNKEIGWRLTISEKTVKHYLTSILGKLNVKNRVQAALLVAGRHEPLSYA